MNDGLRTSLVVFLVAAGAAVALAAIPIVLGPDASDEAEAAANLVATVLLLAGGWLLDETAARMRSVLWLLAVVAWAVVLVVVFTEVVDGPDGKWLVTTVAALTLALALPLWWVERRSLQFLAVFASATLAVAAAVYTTQQVSLLGFDAGPELPDLTWSALVTVVFGAAALWKGATGKVEPHRTAAVIGSLALIAGASLLDVDVLHPGPTTPALVAGLVASAAVLFIGEGIADRAVAGIGIVGVLFLATVLVGDVATSQEAGVAAVVLGLLAAAAGVALSRRRPSAPPPPQD